MRRMEPETPSPDQPLTYPTVCAYLCVDGARAAMDFYIREFGATERFAMEVPGVGIAHGELAFGDSVVMISDPFPGSGAIAPVEADGWPSHLSVVVDDVDASWASAIAAGCRPLREPTDQFYGDRTCTFVDPFGHRWTFVTNIEPLTPAEIHARMG